MAKTRMYILVRERIPLGVAMVSVAHASLRCYLQFKDDPHLQKWAAESFRKCVVAVTDEQFDAAKAVKNHVMVCESNFGNEEVALAFCPRPSKRWPREFAEFPLYDAPLQEGDHVQHVDGNGGIGRVDALGGDQRRPHSVRVRFADEYDWYDPQDLRRAYPEFPTTLIPGVLTST